jgi:peptide/nickel transport system permease protein
MASVAPATPLEWGTSRRRWRTVTRYIGRNGSLAVGALLLLALLALVVGGHLFYDIRLAEPLSASPGKPPSARYWLGTDKQGRDLFAMLIVGTWLSCKVGLLAGFIGVLIGTVLGFVGGFCRGWIDAVISLITDVFLAVPPLLILVVIAANIRAEMTTDAMVWIIAALSRREPARRLRSRVLVMREAGYVSTARLNGTGTMGIIFKEMMPNLIPYLMVSFVLATAAAMLASVGLEALGLGPQNEPTLGMTIYWAIHFSAFLLGIWWWVLTPVITLVVLFVGLYLVTTGLDELANPRLRSKGAGA